MADPRWRFQDCGQPFQILNFITSYCFFSLYKCFLVVYYIKEMTLPILLIFYVSKWRNNKKHYKIEYDVAVTSSFGVESQN